MYKKILVPTDGSACSEQAVKHALELAKPVAAEIIFVHVLEPLPPAISSTSYSKQILEDLKKGAETILNESLELAVEAGVTANAKLVHWVHPSDAVVAMMADCDLVVMGSHGRSGLRRLLLGSVAEEVIRRSKRPVLVVHCLDRD
jgi:nucleotide-binding universal stress UspA family protein